MTTHQRIPEDHDVESLEEAGTWLLDLVAAVDHLRRGIRPGITVWDAIEEALRWHTPRTDEHDPAEPGWDDPRPPEQHPHPVPRPHHRTDQRGGADRGATLDPGDGRPPQRRPPLAPPGTAPVFPPPMLVGGLSTSRSVDATDCHFVCCV